MTTRTATRIDAYVARKQVRIDEYVARVEAWKNRLADERKGQP
jgi:hypothetical protein